MKHRTQKLFLLTLLALLAVGGLQAKKVKFMVNMTGLIKNTTGIHIVGDFQTIAGYAGGDWNSATTTMLPEADTNIYSVVVDLPAMAKYEFKFVNGDQFYEAEFVPIESRVGYLFNDNRWIFIDSLAPDTTVVGPLVFSGNAPIGKRLVRMIVDMHEEATVSPLGVHVEGGFDGFSGSVMPFYMYSFVSGVWEHIGYVDSLTPSTTFRFMNGSAPGDAESITGSCASGGYRLQAMPKDTVLPIVCFGSCSQCLTSAVADAWEPTLELYPNPVRDIAHLRLSNAFGNWQLQVLDLQGRKLQLVDGQGEALVTLEVADFPAGIYFVRLRTEDGKTLTQKLVHP